MTRPRRKLRLPPPTPWPVPWAMPTPSNIDRVCATTISRRSGSSEGEDPPAPEPEGDLSSFRIVGKKRARPPRTQPKVALAGAALDGAADEATRSRLAGDEPIAVVIQVPTAAWVDPIASYIRNLGGGRWEIFARDGSNKAHKASAGNSEVSAALARGNRVLGVSPRPELHLPSALTGAADIVIRIAQPTGTVLRDALRRALSGRVPVRIDDGLVAGLDFDAIVASMRAGSQVADAIERLRAASSRRSGAATGAGLPDLATAVEYGAARDWGLALAADIADYRAGRISWAEIDRGVVLHSPPGCGKSLFARILAAACGVPLVTASVGEFFTGEGALGDVLQAQRAVFARAAELAPCLLFLDEIDALPDRRTLSARGRDWWMPVVNDHLLLLDSAISGQREGVVVVGATNMPDRIDPALLRPGRLERTIEIRRPDADGAANILLHHLKGDLANADLARFGRLLAGSTGAEIMEKARAARRAARRAQRPLTEADLLAAILPAGNNSPDVVYRSAIHEGGHAIVALATGTIGVRDIVLSNEDASHGRTLMGMIDQILPDRARLEDMVVAILAGRAAEKICLGSMSVGAGGGPNSDLGIATGTVAALHASYGLGAGMAFRCAHADALGALENDPQLRRAVERDLRRLQRRADQLVRQYRDAIVALAERLLRDRHVTGEDARRFLEMPTPSNRRRRSATIH